MAQTTKTIKFNWELYKANPEKYTLVTKKGELVTDLTFLPAKKFQLIGLINGDMESWDIKGLYRLNFKSDDDLQLQYTEGIKENWTNLYQLEDGRMYIGNIYDSAKEAKQNKAGQETLDSRKACFLKTINLNDFI
jgi:hypothetical protein